MPTYSSTGKVYLRTFELFFYVLFCIYEQKCFSTSILNVCLRDYLYVYLWFLYISTYLRVLFYVFSMFFYVLFYTLLFYVIWVHIYEVFTLRTWTPRYPPSDGGIANGITITRGGLQTVLLLLESSINSLYLSPPHRFLTSPVCVSITVYRCIDLWTSPQRLQPYNYNVCLTSSLLDN